MNDRFSFTVILLIFFVTLNLCPINYLPHSYEDQDYLIFFNAWWSYIDI